MIKVSHRSLLFWLCLAFCGSEAATRTGAPQTAPALSVTTDRLSAIYKQGEPVVFKVQLTADSRIANDAELAWKLSKDGVPPFKSGKLKLVDGRAPSPANLASPDICSAAVTGTAEGQADHCARRGCH